MSTDKDRRLVDSNIEADSSKDNSNAGGMTPDIKEEYY